MNTAQPESAALILLGAGGHARVLQALVQALGHRLIGVVDPVLARQGPASWRGLAVLAVLGDDDALLARGPGEAGLVNGIGPVPHQRTRQSVHERFHAAGFHFPSLVHPHAWVAPDVVLADGVQVMAGAVVQPACRLGSGSTLNTGSRIDHDCEIGAHAHIAPGAVLCGGVRVHQGAFVGAGAVVLPGLSVGAGAIVAAGSTLTRDLAAGAVHHRGPHPRP